MILIPTIKYTGLSALLAGHSDLCINYLLSPIGIAKLGLAKSVYDLTDESWATPAVWLNGDVPIYARIEWCDPQATNVTALGNGVFMAISGEACIWTNSARTWGMATSLENAVTLYAAATLTV